MGAQGGHKARPYSANDALTTYTAVRIRYRICAVDHLVEDFMITVTYSASTQLEVCALKERTLSSHRFQPVVWRGITPNRP